MHSPAVLGGVALLLSIGRYMVSYTQAERKIKALGGHAPAFKSWWPLGLEFLWKAITTAGRHESLGFWQDLMTSFANPNQPCTLEIYTVGARVIFTVDEENIKAILATQFQDYGKGEQFHKEWHDFLGDSIFTTDGDLWHSSRQLIRPQFMKDRVSDLHVFEKHSETLIYLLGGGNTGSGTPVNLVDVFFKYTLDAATDFLLGRSVDSMKNPMDVFSNAFADVQHTQALISRAGPLNPLLSRKKFREGLKTMDSFIEPFIEETLRYSKDELDKISKSDEGYTFLYALAGFTRDPKVLRDQLTAVLLAGRDTTAMTLSWLFCELSRRPEIMAKLRREIEYHVGMDRAPTYADLKSMKYLQHVINETLRLYPIVPYNIRIALKDTSLPRGGGADGMQPIGVPANTPIGYSTLGMQRRAELYPAVSEKFAHHLEFSPERWDHWTPKTWTYIPFNGGPRICIGQQFALTEIGYTTVRILQKFSRLENTSSVVPKLKADIVLQPSDGVDVIFHE